MHQTSNDKLRAVIEHSILNKFLHRRPVSEFCLSLPAFRFSWFIYDWLCFFVIFSESNHNDDNECTWSPSIDPSDRPISDISQMACGPSSSGVSTRKMNRVGRSTSERSAMVAGGSIRQNTIRWVCMKSTCDAANQPSFNDWSASIKARGYVAYYSIFRKIRHFSVRKQK